jgi:oxygen-independent coproporphyrinogen III oxidase
VDTALYLHIPFCTHRCAYCDFNTYARQEALIPAYLQALSNEIEYVGRQAGRLPEQPVIQTVFFGGGTPSLLPAEGLGGLMESLRTVFDLDAGAEITLEANPGTCTRAYLDDLRRLGVNRLSFGVQSASPDELRLLERQHDFFAVIESIKWARQAGFANLNLDLIYGLPEQSLSSWQATLKRCLDLGPEHISAYALTLEHGTPFGRWSTRGLLPIPDPDLAAGMYEWGCEFLKSAGYIQYEISNWARSSIPVNSSHPPSSACRHNLQYWRNLPYLGLGAGAHGYANGMRYSNALRIKTYIERLAVDSRPPDGDFPLSPAAVNRTVITPDVEMQETLLTGLRLTREGVSATGFASRFGRDLSEVFAREISHLTGAGLLEWQADRLRLTRRGRLLGNRVFIHFVGSD